MSSHMHVWKKGLRSVAKVTKFSHSRIRNSDQSPVTFPTDIIARGALPHAAPTDGPSEYLPVGERLAHLQGEFYGPQGLCQATINKLTDDDLLEIFVFYLEGDENEDEEVDKWHTLVHVCQRWRNIVFASPHRLDLQLLCTHYRPVRATLDIWPVLPLVIKYTRTNTSQQDADNLIATLEHHDRVRGILLDPVPTPVWETLIAAMQVPIPELKFLWLWPEGDRSMSVFPDSFLGGSAPRLEVLTLAGIPFPGVWNLLLSASDLVHLELWHLPHSGYISPESVVACLSSLNRLETLHLGFESPLSRPDQSSPPPQTRAILPALRHLSFAGMVDYSEDLLARIDAPVLDRLEIVFFMDLVFDIPHFKQFIGRAKRLNPPMAGKLWFQPRSIILQLDELRGPLILLEVRCERIDWQLDSMALLCDQLSPFFSSTERLDLFWRSTSSEPQGKDDMESAQFLEIFLPFTAIRSLDVSWTLVPFIARALQELIGESTTEVLHYLRDLYVPGAAMPASIQEDIQRFIEARRLSGQPVALYYWGGYLGDQ